MGSVCENLLAGVVSGVIASALFLFFMLIIRPRISLSDGISVDKNGTYRIKIVNKSRCQLSNLKYVLRLCDDHGDKIVDVLTIKPAKPPLDSIPKYSKKDKNSMYAIRISYKGKGGKCIISNCNSYLEFTVSAKHAFSNTYSVVSKTYTCDDIKFGVFETGKSTNIIRDPEQNCQSSVSCVKTAH